LILDKKPDDIFPKGDLDSFSEHPWRAIQITTNSAPMDVGVISSVTAPLARAGISINYCSTCNSDFILVEASKMQAAKETLQQNFSVLWVDPEDETTPQPKTNSEKYSVNEGVVTTANTASDYNILEADSKFKLQFASIKMDECLKELLQLIFYPTNSFRFFSLTEVEEEISLMVDKDTLVSFGGTLHIVLRDMWVPIKRKYKRGFGEVGVINALANPLSKAGTPILYLSTFKTSYILVREQDHSGAVTTLQNNGFVFSTDKR